jgi:hypothetical protein
LRAQPHPAGFALPAWQTWPTDQTQDEQKALQDWLAWGKKHGLQVQATRAESGQGTGLWEGRLPALLAAWHGLPQAVPRMVITGFECERMYPAGVNAVKWDDRQQDSGKLRLHMHWTVLRETTLSTSVIAKNTAHAHAKLQLPKTNDTHGTATTGKAFVYQPFGEQSLVSALPAQALSRQLWAHGLPSWQTQPLEALRWRGSASSGTRRLAWVASEGLVQAVKPGDRLGQDWGVVTAIEHDHLQLREWHADSQGQWVGQLRRFPEGHAR